MATIERIEQLKKELEQIQRDFDKDLLSKLNNLLSQNQNQNVVMTPEFERDFNRSYNNLVVDAQKRANAKAAALDLSRLDINEADLGKVSDLLIPYNSPRARDKMAYDQQNDAGVTQAAGSRYEPMDIFKNADESPNDKIPQQEPANFDLNREQISSFLNKQTKDLKLQHSLKFGMKMPAPPPGNKPEEPRLIARALPRPMPR